MNIQEILEYIVKWGAEALGGVLEQVLILVVMIEWGRLPFWAYPMVAAAIAYFICPLDAMPDPIFVDDAGVLAGAIAALGRAVTDDVRGEAARRARSMLGF
jgi:uncharacterized membrane protein YkvA (DUF1232 family)